MEFLDQDLPFSHYQKGLINAKKVGESLRNKYNQLNLDFDIHISTVNENGIKIIEFK